MFSMFVIVWFNVRVIGNVALLVAIGRTTRLVPLLYTQLTEAYVQVPVPLTIFRTNSKFDRNWERSSLKYA